MTFYHFRSVDLNMDLKQHAVRQTPSPDSVTLQLQWATYAAPVSQLLIGTRSDIYQDAVCQNV